jgi:hypothetical protein
MYSIGYALQRGQYHSGKRARVNIPTSVFRQSCIVIINKTGGWVKDDVFKNRTELDGVENIGLLFTRKTDTLCVALQDIISEAMSMLLEHLHHPQC